jgi:hypothetical protein
VLTKSVTGVSQPVMTFHQIDVIPNPNSGQFQLKYVSHLLGKLNLKIMDMNGREVKNMIADKYELEFSYSISLKNLPKGLYSAELTLKNQTDHALFLLK